MQAKVDGSTEAGRQETIEDFRIISQQQQDAVFNASEIELYGRLARRRRLEERERRRVVQQHPQFALQQQSQNSFKTFYKLLCDLCQPVWQLWLWLHCGKRLTLSRQY